MVTRIGAKSRGAVRPGVVVPRLLPKKLATVSDFGDVVGRRLLRRNHHDHRLAVVAHSKAELSSALDAFAAGEASHPESWQAVRRLPSVLELVFVFAGQGPQWWAMGRELLEKEPVFRGP